MPIHSSAVGTKVTSPPVTISTRQCLAYAAGLDIRTPALFDDLHNDFAACPQMCVSLEWPLVSHPDMAASYKLDPSEISRGVHYVQDSIFHAPIRPGDALTTSTELVSMTPGPAGARTIQMCETKTIDGATKVTSYTSSVIRGVEIAGDPVTGPPVPDWPTSDSAVDAGCAEIFINPGLPHIYTECANIWNPIHTERAVAKAVDLPDVILHGTATWALAGREIIDRFADGDPARLKRLSGQFSAMVMPGTTISIRFEKSATENGETIIAYDVQNPDGSLAMKKGKALIAS